MAEVNELQRPCAPDPELDQLAVFQLPMNESIRGLVRQVIREHLDREADPALKAQVEVSGGRPRRRGSYLEHDLFAVLSMIPGITDAARHRAIAKTVSALTAEPNSAKGVKNRLAAERAEFKRRPRFNGPPIHTGVSTTQHARSIKRGIADARANDARLRELK